MSGPLLLDDMSGTPKNSFFSTSCSPPTAGVRHLPVLFCQASCRPPPLHPAVIREPMASACRLLTYPGQFPTAEPPDALSVDSDVVGILAAFLCVVGLAAETGSVCSRLGVSGSS